MTIFQLALCDKDEKSVFITELESRYKEQIKEELNR
jgi:hypothetical protein